MSSARLYSRALIGIRAGEIAVEVHLSNGLPSVSIVGLPETATRESKDRVRSALLSAGFEFPDRRITVNLAPADLPKHGTGFDLPIALAVLAASGQLPATRVEGHEFVGELSLGGGLRHVRGVLPAALAARDSRRTLIVPSVDIAEAALVDAVRAFGAATLIEVVDHLLGVRPLAPVDCPCAPRPSRTLDDLADVQGQLHARRALEIAAAGGHNLLLIGPPGTGKTMLARRLPGILPPLDESQALDVAAIRSAAGRPIDPQRWRERPIRAPHHSASSVAVVGGGGVPRPGEISLAHHGVLFLDELPEFRRDVLESLREPLEAGAVTISRAARSTQFPARFQLVAAMNPCPCGLSGDRTDRCRCTPDQINRYVSRVSGPLLDRIDMHIEVAREGNLSLSDTGPAAESSAAVRARVIAARDRQIARGELNSTLRISRDELQSWCDASALRLLEQATERLQLSARATHRVLRVARTIADLADVDRVEETHVAEAIGLRCLDRRMK